MEEMSAGNRCHLNMFCDNVPTALGGAPLRFTYESLTGAFF